MKTNREKNLEHDTKQVLRPKTKQYQFEPLAQVVAQWVRG